MTIKQVLANKDASPFPCCFVVVVLVVVVVMVVIVTVVWMHMVIINHSCSLPIDNNGKISYFGEFKECVSDGRTDQRTDRPTDGPTDGRTDRPTDGQTLI